MAVQPITLSDSSGNLYTLAVSNGGVLSAAPAGGTGTANQTLILGDKTRSTLWAIGVNGSGNLTGPTSLGAYSGTYPIVAIVVSPNGTQFSVTITTGGAPNTFSEFHNVSMPMDLMPGGKTWEGQIVTVGNDAIINSTPFAFDPVDPYAYAMTEYSQRISSFIYQTYIQLTRIKLDTYTRDQVALVPASPEPGLDLGHGAILESATNVICDADGFLYVTSATLKVGTGGYSSRVHKLNKLTLAETATSSYATNEADGYLGYTMRLVDKGGIKYLATASINGHFALWRRDNLTLVLDIPDITGGDTYYTHDGNIVLLERMVVDSSGDVWLGTRDHADLIKVSIPSGTVTIYKDIWVGTVASMDMWYSPSDNSVIIGDRTAAFRKVSLGTQTTLGTLPNYTSTDWLLVPSLFRTSTNQRAFDPNGGGKQIFKGKVSGTLKVLIMDATMAVPTDITSLFEPTPGVVAPPIDPTADDDQDLCYDSVRGVLWTLQPKPFGSTKATKWEAFVFATPATIAVTALPATACYICSNSKGDLYAILAGDSGGITPLLVGEGEANLTIPLTDLSRQSMWAFGVNDSGVIVANRTGDYLVGSRQYAGEVPNFLQLASTPNRVLVVITLDANGNIFANALQGHIIPADPVLGDLINADIRAMYPPGVQPGGIGTQVTMPSETEGEKLGLWVFGCQHFFNNMEVLWSSLQCGTQVALLVCPMCRYLQRIIAPASAIYSEFNAVLFA